MQKYVISIVSLLFIFILYSCDVTEPIIENYTPDGSYEIKWQDLSVLNESKDLRIGGFSGLAYAGRRNFYAITNRGPSIEEFNLENGKSFLVEPNYTPQILLLELQDDKSIKITKSIQLTNPFEELVSGFAPSGPYNSNEIFTNPNAKNDEWGIDPSGLFYDIQQNHFWIADKYGPSFFEATIEGKLVRRIRPEEGLREHYLSRRMDGGFTGITVDSKGKIYGITKRVLNNFPDSLKDYSKLNKKLRRIQVQDPKILTIETDFFYFYYVEEEDFDGLPAEHVFLGDIAHVNDTTFLVTEYGEFNGVKRSLLYKINIDPNSTFEAKVGHEALRGKSIETLTETDISELSIRPVIKTMLVDLKQYNIDRPEGLTIVNKNKLAIINNNKFGIKEGNISDNSYSLDKSPISLKIINLEKSLNIE